MAKKPSVIKCDATLSTTNCDGPQKAETEYRHPCGVRFDLIDPEFIRAMATVMAVGAKKYGDHNWKKGLTGENGGVNHAMGHLVDYMAGKKSDHSDDVRFNLAQVAVNAMFEYHLVGQKGK